MYDDNDGFMIVQVIDFIVIEDGKFIVIVVIEVVREDVRYSGS